MMGIYMKGRNRGGGGGAVVATLPFELKKSHGSLRSCFTSVSLTTIVKDTVIIAKRPACVKD